MLPRKNRLDLKKDFFEIKRKGRLLRGKLFNFLFQQEQPNFNKKLLTAELYPPVFAFVVSKKIDKRAVKRNKAKRLLSEVVKSFLSQIQPGVKGVFLVKKEILGKSFAEIKNEIEVIFKKGDLFK